MRVRAAAPWLAATLLYAALIYWLSDAPRDIPDPVRDIPLVDKLAHALLYAGLGLLSCLTLRRGWPHWPMARLWWTAWITATLYGVSDEWHQSFVPGRTPAIDDVVADAAGAALALWWWSRKRR